jgi:hypothetical protein
MVRVGRTTTHHMATITPFQQLVLLAFVAGANTVSDIVTMTKAFVEDVECILNELEAAGRIQVVHRPLGVYTLTR